ncbi:hypothetical protein NC661_08685 [Aquibacillus koreensis]|uniref:Uncharacterized protein n=1 Tax=Aquibacillus koreensis TaxID=279446 RepID=A0A9X3WLH0_9BACI|nr:hypothetical protein [Aquibacillus koreensis]MCT2535985.1 hypothetical protein [Aquibacillus koreensis]MDC3420441.1 hypothetical protein [Aquibacillus koreensis]
MLNLFKKGKKKDDSCCHVQIQEVKEDDSKDELIQKECCDSKQKDTEE